MFFTTFMFNNVFSQSVAYCRELQWSQLSSCLLVCLQNHFVPLWLKCALYLEFKKWELVFHVKLIGCALYFGLKSCGVSAQDWCASLAYQLFIHCIVCRGGKSVDDMTQRLFKLMGSVRERIKRLSIRFFWQLLPASSLTLYFYFSI